MRHLRSPSLILVCGLMCGCSHYFTGQMDLDRVQHGEAYVQAIDLPGDHFMIRVVVALDAPPWRVFNLQRDIEGYPLWQAGLASGRVISRKGDDIDAEFTMTPAAFHNLGPVRQHIRIDPQAGETSMTMFENDWLRNGQIVCKVTPIDDDQRSLINFYFTFEVKFAVGPRMREWAEERFAQTALNIRKAVLLPQYEAPAVPVTTRTRWKVLVPSFSTEGTSEEQGRTLTRVFAEELVRKAAWDVSTPQEIAAMLNYNRQQALVGCDAGTACGIDLGKALGADHLVVGSIGKVGGKIVVTASLIKVPEGTVERRTAKDADEKDVIDAVRATAGSLTNPPPHT